MKNLNDPEARIQERLEEIKAVPPRNPQAAARARARFLAQASAASEARRRSGWGFLFGQRKFALNAIVALVMVIGLFVGGGTTVRAAQDDLPNEPLYGVKTWSEDLSLKLTLSPEAKAERLMELTQTRVQEITRMVEAGQTPPEQVQLRLEQHLEQAFQLSTTMEDADLDKTLLQLHDELQQQERDLQLLQNHAAQNAQPVLERTHLMLETHLQVVDSGLRDREAFRDTVNNGLHLGQTQTPPAASVPPTLEDLPGPATTQPGNGNQGNGIGPNPTPEPTDAELTATPENNGNNPASGNNPGNQDKDKGKEKDPKDKDKENKGSNGKDPK